MSGSDHDFPWKQMATDDRIRVELLVETSNEILSYADASIIRDLISETQRHLEPLNQEIIQAQQNLSDLMSRQSQGVARISRLRVGISSHKNVPSEVLAKVFVFCLAGQPVSVPDRSYLSVPPWNLSRVCSRWRTIALAEPRLWTSLYIGPMKKAPQPVVHELLSRSGNFELTLNVDSTELAAKILNIILDHRTRIQSLELPIARENLEYVTQLSSFSKLKCLTFHYGKIGMLLDPLPLPPTIQRLCLTGSSDYHHLFPSIGISTFRAWANISHLFILPSVHIPSATMLTILQYCPMLVECETALDLSFDLETDSPGHLEPFVVPLLQSFTIKPQRASLGPFLDALILPCLISFSIVGRMALPWPVDEFLGLIRRSECHMRCFTSIGSNMPVECAEPLVHAIPDLEQLVLETRLPISVATLGVVREANIWPDSESICVCIESPLALLGFLESRWEFGGVQTSIIFICGQTDEEGDGGEHLKDTTGGVIPEISAE